MRRQLGGLTILALLFLVCFTAIAWAEDPASQDGLPPELVIPDKPDLGAQLRTLQDLRNYCEGQKTPASGVTGGLKSFFGGGSKALPIPPAELAANGGALNGRLVSVSGVYQAVGAEQGRFNYEGGFCLVTVPASVAVQGLKRDQLAGMPVTIEGIAEASGSLGQLRAAKIEPCLWLILLRIARVYERQSQYPQAEETYEKAVQVATAAKSPFAAYAKLSAARLAYDELRDIKKAKNHYANAWNPYTPRDRRGKPLFHTWVPREDGSGWDKLGVADAIRGPLDKLNNQGTWYRVMAFFVDLGGGIRWLGILMISILSRVLIWPLTKKQLTSAEAMKRLQPQIKALQERYTDDKQKFQEEFWRLCQANGVNPLGGCLPMIIQIPILIVLWQGIRDYIVQFDGHGFLWVKNLAAPDTPLLIAYTVSMIFFQKMTQKLQPNPTMTDQQQQQQQMMTYMMPLMFFFFFKTFPAAFLLYWLATNIVYFVQQAVYTRGQNKRAAGDGTASLVEETPTDGMVKVMSTKGGKQSGGEANKPGRADSTGSSADQPGSRKQGGKPAKR